VKNKQKEEGVNVCIHDKREENERIGRRGSASPVMSLE